MTGDAISHVALEIVFVLRGFTFDSLIFCCLEFRSRTFSFFFFLIGGVKGVERRHVLPAFRDPSDKVYCSSNRGDSSLDVT